jgi:integrase
LDSRITGRSKISFSNNPRPQTPGQQALRRVQPHLAPKQPPAPQSAGVANPTRTPAILGVEKASTAKAVRARAASMATLAPPRPAPRANNPLSTEKLRQLVAHFKRQALEPGTWRNVYSTAKLFCRFTAKHKMLPLPIRTHAVAMYMVQYCLNGNTTRSLKNVLTQLKRFCGEYGFPWLTPPQLLQLRDVQRGLAKHDHSVPRRKLPLTLAILAKLRDTNPADRQLLAMSMLAHDGLLRGGELCFLNRQDVVEYEGGFILHIHKSKANKTGCRETVVIPNRDPAGAAHLIKAHLLCTPFASGRSPLFINTTSRTRMSKKTFSIAIRAKLVLAGYPSHSYSAHSFRSGGATDLFHNNCPALYIKMHGRWKSDTFHIYIRDNPDARAMQIALAFRAATV